MFLNVNLIENEQIFLSVCGFTHPRIFYSFNDAETYSDMFRININIFS